MLGSHLEIRFWIVTALLLPIIVGVIWCAIHTLYGGVHKVVKKPHMMQRHRDPDRLMSYYTRQQVEFLAWRLGALYWAIQSCVAVIVVGYVLVYKEGYMAFEESKGSVVTHCAGDALSVNMNTQQSRYFGIEELTHPGLENGNVFIATKQLVRNQTRGYCNDPDAPCSTDSDCNVHGKGTCTEDGVCRVFSWCDVNDVPEKYDLKVDLIQIWTRAFIQFLWLDATQVLSTESANAEPSADTVFSVRDLLGKVEPIPVNVEEVSRLGALFEVDLRWNCDLPRHRGISHREVERHGADIDQQTVEHTNRHVARKCKPLINIRRLDTLLDPDSIGYHFSYAETVDAKHRLLNEVSGLRFLFRTSGLGKRLSVTSTVTNVSTSMTLVMLAAIVSDFVMTRFFRNHKKYKARKYDKTPDFSEYLPRLAERRKQKTLLSEIEEFEKKVQEREAHWMRKLDAPDAEEKPWEERESRRYQIGSFMPV